jgi:hypothetical protein
MSPSSPNKGRTRLAQAIAGLFIVSVTVLALSELVAQTPRSTAKQTTPKTTLTGTPTPTLTAAPVCAWPPPDPNDQCTVMKAFVIAMKRSTDPNDPIRTKLLECDPLETCASARDAVQKILKEDLHSPFTIPPNVFIRFYFDPKVPGGFLDTKSPSTVEMLVPRPENSCYTIFSLPANRPDAVPNNHWDDPVLAFGLHLRCCYQPWAPTVTCN